MWIHVVIWRPSGSRYWISKLVGWPLGDANMPACANHAVHHASSCNVSILWCLCVAACSMPRHLRLTLWIMQILWPCLRQRNYLGFEVTNDVKDYCTILVRDVLAVWFLRAVARHQDFSVSPEVIPRPNHPPPKPRNGLGWDSDRADQETPDTSNVDQSLHCPCRIFLHSLHTTRPRSLHNIGDDNADEKDWMQNAHCVFISFIVYQHTT